MSGYAVWVTPAAWAEIKDLPGNVGHRVRRAVSSLATDPRPSASRGLTVPDVTAEVRRLRLDRWRVVYLVSDDDRTVDVIAIRRRPPYDYGDLAALLGEQA